MQSSWPFQAEEDNLVEEREGAVCGMFIESSARWRWGKEGRRGRRAESGKMWGVVQGSDIWSKGKTEGKRPRWGWWHLLHSNPDYVISFWRVLLLLTVSPHSPLLTKHTPHALMQSHNSPSTLISLYSFSSMMTVVCAYVCAYFFSSYFQFSTSICLPPPLSNKVNEDGKWWDSRWYFSKSLPSNNGAAAGRKPQSLWMKCARAGLCITSTGLEQRLDLYIGL